MTTVEKINDELERFAAGKRETDLRVARCLEEYRRGFSEPRPGEIRRTPWLFSSVVNKHADLAADLPRIRVEGGKDRRAAAALERRIADILEDNLFGELWSDAIFTKLVTGTVCWAVTRGENGVALTLPDLRNVFWEPGVLDLDDSSAVYVRATLAPEVFFSRRPEARGADISFTGDGSRVEIFDRYSREGGRLRLLTFSGRKLLFDSDRELGGRGFYAHGRYPLVLDRLFPDDRSPAGFGFYDLYAGVARDVDLLSAALTQNVNQSAKRRYFCRVGGGINEREFGDLNRDFVHVASSSLGEDAIREIVCEPLPAQSLELLKTRVDELKTASFNRDAVNGGTETGLRSGAAISAVQEAAMKTSRDIFATSRRSLNRLFGAVLALAEEDLGLRGKEFRLVFDEPGKEVNA